MDAIPSLKKHKPFDASTRNQSITHFFDEMTAERTKQVNDKFDKIKREQDQLVRLGELYRARYSSYYDTLCDSIIEALNDGDKVATVSIYQDSDTNINRIYCRAREDFLKELVKKGYTYEYRTERDCDLETFTFLDIKLD